MPDEAVARLRLLDSEPDGSDTVMNNDITDIRAEIRDLRREMNINFRWTIGIVIGMAGLVISVLK